MSRTETETPEPDPPDVDLGTGIRSESGIRDRAHYVERMVKAAGLRAKPLRSDPKADIPEQVRVGLDTRLRALVAHDPGTLAGEDPEELHQMRVSVRRMRAMLRSAEPFLDHRWSNPLRRELGWLGGCLGPVRDLDVLLGHLRGQIDDLPENDRNAASHLIAELDGERSTARRELVNALNSDRYTALLETLADAVNAPLPAAEPSKSAPDGKSELRSLVTTQLRKMRKLVKRAGTDATDSELHEIRIRGKRLRYTAELAAPVLGKRVQHLLQAAKRLQDVLGEHQDAAVAEHRIRQLVSHPRPDLDTDQRIDIGFAAGRLVEREAARRAECRNLWWACWQDVHQRAQAL